MTSSFPKLDKSRLKRKSEGTGEAIGYLGAFLTAVNA